jgi:hypothetical protein
MMRCSLIYTYSGSRRHRTLLVSSKRCTVFAWAHRFERPWRCFEPGILCIGAGLLSVNIYSATAFK